MPTQIALISLREAGSTSSQPATSAGLDCLWLSCMMCSGFNLCFFALISLLAGGSTISWSMTWAAWINYDVRFLCFDWLADGSTSSWPVIETAWINYDVQFLCFEWLADGRKSSQPISVLWLDCKWKNKLTAYDLGSMDKLWRCSVSVLWLACRWYKKLMAYDQGRIDFLWCSVSVLLIGLQVGIQAHGLWPRQHCLAHCGCPPPHPFMPSHCNWAHASLCECPWVTVWLFTHDCVSAYAWLCDCIRMTVWVHTHNCVTAYAWMCECSCVTVWELMRHYVTAYAWLFMLIALQC